MMRPRIVIALGGNALLRRGEPAEAETQRRNVLEAASALAAVAADHELVITHGNGPQVIDKDLTAALLAEALGAERLVLATDVSFIELDWGTPMSTPIEATTPSTLRRTRFTPSSMGRKVEAACRFVERTGGVCAIGALTEISELVRESAGTQIVPERIALSTP